METISYYYASTEFVVHPSNRIVAPNSYASFNCVVSGDTSAYIRWKVNGLEFGEHDSEPNGVEATWTTTLNSSLNISTHGSNANGTTVLCKAVELMIHRDSSQATLKVAGVCVELFSVIPQLILCVLILQVHQWNQKN